MIRRIRYFLGMIISIPLLPLLAVQGKRIRNTIPDLPEASEPYSELEPDANDNFHIAFIGESTIAGVGVDSHKNGLAGATADTMAEHLARPVTWKVYAKSGYTAKSVRKNLLHKIEEDEINLFVIGLGANDAFKLNRPWRWGKEIRNIIRMLREKYPETPIAFLNMPPIKEFPAFTALTKFTIGNLVELHGLELSRIIEEFDGVYFNSELIKLEVWLEKFEHRYDRSDFFSDGVHPSQITYQAWGQNFAEFLSDQKVVQN